MSRKLIYCALAPFVCFFLFASSAHGQSPTSLAENSAEYNAYVNSYIAMVQADGIANVIDEGVEGDVAAWIADFVDDGFDHCYIALVKGNDKEWSHAADDLEMALFWCDTLYTFAQDSQSSTTLYNINSLMWRLEIAIDNCRAAAPQRLFYRSPSSYSFSR